MRVCGYDVEELIIMAKGLKEYGYEPGHPDWSAFQAGYAYAYKEMEMKSQAALEKMVEEISNNI